MKNRLVVMGITFLVMIFLTPLVFSKLMNAKFDKMLDNLRKEGYQIKEIANKSTYLTTKRVFEIVIPQIDQKITYIKMKVTAIFKNLPVTDVIFDSYILEIGGLKELNNFQKPLHIVVVTPNFKKFNYKVDDNKLFFSDTILSFRGLKGDYYKNITKTEIKELKFRPKESEEIYALAKNVKIKTEKKDKIFYTSTFDLFLKLKGDVNIQNVNLSGYYTDNLKFLNLYVPAVVVFDKLKIQTLKAKMLFEKLNKELKGDIQLNIKKMLVNNKEIGFLEFKDKFVLNDYLDAKIYLKTTKEIAVALAILDPRIALIFKKAKFEKNYVILDTRIYEKVSH